MAWDDDKSTASDPDNPTADEQLTADEWDAMVSDQKGHASRHEKGGADPIENLGNVYLGHVSSTPTDVDIGSGNTAFYAKSDGNLYKKPHGGSESQVGGGSDTRTDVSDDGTTVVTDTDDINFSTNLTVTDDGDNSVTVTASGGSGGTDTPYQLTLYTESASIAGGGSATMFTHSGTGINHGFLNSGAAQQVQTEMSVDSEASPSFDFGNLDGLEFGDEGRHDEYVGAGFASSDNEDRQYLYYPDHPIRFSSQLEYVANRQAGSSSTTHRVVVPVFDDYSGTLSSPPEVSLRAAGEKDTTGSTGTTNLVDTGTGVTGAFHGVFLELDGGGGSDFGARVYFDGEASASISIDFTFWLPAHGDSDHNGNSFSGVGPNDTTADRYGFYFNPGAFGLESWFSDGMVVDAVNNSGASGDYDWTVLWSEE